MRLRNLQDAILLLIEQGVSPDTEVSMFTGWEGETFLTPEHVAYLPSGIDPMRMTMDGRQHQPVVLMFKGSPKCAEASNRRLAR